MRRVSVNQLSLALTTVEGKREMSWAKIDDQIAFHPKVLEAGNEAFGAWVRMLAHCCAQLTDGVVSKRLAETIASPAVVNRLVGSGLLDVIDSGYAIHDFHEWNPSAEEVRRKRKADLDRKTRGRGSQGRDSVGRITSEEIPRGIHADVQQEFRLESTRTSNRIPTELPPVPSPSRLPMQAVSGFSVGDSCGQVSKAQPPPTPPVGTVGEMPMGESANPCRPGDTLTRLHEQDGPVVMPDLSTRLRADSGAATQVANSRVPDHIYGAQVRGAGVTNPGPRSRRGGRGGGPTAEQRYRAAYEAGVRAAAPGVPFALPAAKIGAVLGPFLIEHAVDAAGAPLTQDGLDEWIRVTAEAFRRSTDHEAQYWGGWNVLSFGKWLNSGRPSKGDNHRGRIVQSERLPEAEERMRKAEDHGW